jgi:hypothetical protein
VPIKNILFCYCRIPSFTNAVRDYVSAFGEHSRHRIHYFDMDSGPIDFPLEIFDAVIFNYCFWARRLPLPDYLHKKIGNFNGLKIAIFQDEYDYFLWHEKTVILFGINIIVTCVPQKHWVDVFRDDAFRRVTFYSALTGLLLTLMLVRPLINCQKSESGIWVIVVALPLLHMEG